MIFRKAISWGFSLLCALSFSAWGADGVKITELKDRARVEIGGKLFTEYFFTNALRPYCHPLLGPDELPMTRNFPMKNVPGEEQDHPHHRSFWYAHGSVNGLDFWDDKKSNSIVHLRFKKIKSGKKTGIIQSENNWTTADGKVICTDERTLRFYGQSNPKIIDFEITLRASHGDVVFGDTKEGSMAIRVAESMKLAKTKRGLGQGQIVQSTGVTGTNTWGKRAEWCDYHGPVEGKTAGIAIFDHPQNPRHPTWWHVRDYGLFAANPFGPHYFENAPPGTGDFKIAAGKSATFRYRIILHEGDEKAADIVGLYKKYAKEKF